MQEKMGYKISFCSYICELCKSVLILLSFIRVTLSLSLSHFPTHPHTATLGVYLFVRKIVIRMYHFLFIFCHASAPLLFKFIK